MLRICHFILLSLSAFLLFFLLAFSGAYAQPGAYDWDEVLETSPGIRLAQTSVSEPRLMKIYCLRIDTDHPEISFYTTPRSNNWVENISEVTRKTTRNFLNESRASGMNMVAAINAAPWTPWPAPCEEETDADVLGLLISDGILVSPQGTYPSFIVYKNGDVALSATSPSTDLEEIWVAISGYDFVLVDGAVSNGGTDVHPRTGIGVCTAGRYVYCLAIDGRQRKSEGATTTDVGQWLLYYGAYNGLNMDGGGSTTLVLWSEDAPCRSTRLANNLAGCLPRTACSGIFNSSEAQVVNKPVGCSDVGTERAIGGNLGVYYKPPP